MIQINNLSMSFGAQVLFENISFNINDRERIGLVGRNGSGKTTIFKILTGQLSPDDGQVNFPNNYTVGYLQQHLQFSQPTVLDEACLGLKPEDQHEVWKVQKILTGLGFSVDDQQRAPAEFSGGYQVRLNLAKVLVSEPNLLLLDEPTNYLDIVSIRWLTAFLRKWPNELMIITHDRNVMDAITTHTMAIHRHQIKKIEGETLKLYEQIAMEEEVYERARINQSKKQKETEQFIERFRAKANLARMVQSRVKALAREGKKEELRKIQELDFRFRSAEFRAQNMMQVEDISFGYNPDQKLINGFSLDLLNKERICIIGKNGKGKSTLLRLLADELQPNSGQIKINPNTARGYFGQTNIERLAADNTIEQELTITRDDLSRSEIRSVCGAMMFSGDQALKKIAVLSGGEKSRVSLGKILLTPSNLLLLDEPTNHLDMESCDSLIAAIDEFPGAVVIVTHNELFLHHLATRLIIFNRDSLTVFNGSYQEFLDKIGWAGEEAGEKKTAIERQGSRKFKKQRIALQNESRKQQQPFKELIKQLEEKIYADERVLQQNNQRLLDAAAVGDSELIRDLQIANHQYEATIEECFLQMTAAEESLNQIVDQLQQSLSEIAGD